MALKMGPKSHTSSKINQNHPRFTRHPIVDPDFPMEFPPIICGSFHPSFETISEQRGRCLSLTVFWTSLPFLSEFDGLLVETWSSYLTYISWG